MGPDELTLPLTEIEKAELLCVAQQLLPDAGVMLLRRALFALALACWCATTAATMRFTKFAPNRGSLAMANG